MFKKAMGLILSICTLCAVAATPVTSFADVGDTVYANVALGKTVSGDGNRLTGLTNGYVDDEGLSKEDTYWNLANSGEANVVVDLGQRYAISSIVIVPKGGGGNNDMITIQVSEDEAFTSPVTVGNTGEGIEEATVYTSNLGGFYRYVRLVIDENNAFKWSQLEEVEVYAPFTERKVPANCNVAYNKPVYANSGDQNLLPNLVDGNLNNYWDVFNTIYSGYACVDLLGNYILNEIQVYFCDDNVTNQDCIDVMISADGKVWETVASIGEEGVPFGTPLTINMRENETAYRFVKIQQKKFTMNDYTKIAEIKAFVPPTSVGEYDDQGNLACGKNVTTNGTVFVGDGGRAIVDGSFTTFADCLGPVGSVGYFQIDLGYSYDLSSVVFGFRLDGAEGYPAQSAGLSMYLSELPTYSANDKIYTTPSDGVPFKKDVAVHFSEEKKARYITIECPETVRYFALAEVAAYAKTNTQKPCIVSINQTDGAVTSVTLRTDALCPADGNLYVCRYNANGTKLLDCRVLPGVILDRGSLNHEVDFSGASSFAGVVAAEPMPVEEGDVIKAFLWTDGMKPIIVQ